MEEKVAKAEITPGVIGPSEEDIQAIEKAAKEGKLHPEKGFIPISKEAKIAISAVLGLGCTACSGAAIWELNHPPAVVREISAAQIPPALEVEKIGPQWEEFKPSTETEMVGGERTTYWVSPGDTLEYISAMYETPAEQIVKENNLTSEELKQGQELMITTPIIHILQPGETFENLAEKYGVSVPLLAATNGIFYTESFDFIKPGYQMMIPRSEEELTLKNIVSIRASDEWDKETQEMINKMGEEIVYLLDRMRVFNGVEIIDKGEVLVYPIPPEWEKEFKEKGWRGIWKSREAGEKENIPWGIYVWRDEVLSGEDHAMAAIAHEFGHDCDSEHIIAYVAGFRISQYQSWKNKESFSSPIEIKYYVVQPEDTFKGIAEKLGVSEALLGGTNNIWFDKDIELSPGLELIIPRRESDLTLEGVISIKGSNVWKNPEVQVKLNEAGEQLVRLLDQMRVFDGFEPIDKGEILVHPVPLSQVAGMKERHEVGYFVSQARSEITMEPWGIYILRELLEEGNEVWESVIAHEIGHNFEEKEGVSYLAEIGIIQYYSWILEQNPWGK